MDGVWRTGAMPCRRLISSFAGERRNSSTARAASLRIERTPDRADEGRVRSRPRWHRPENDDAGLALQFALLLEADIGFARREQGGNRPSGRRLDEARLHLLRYPQRAKSCSSAVPLGPVE